MNIFHNIVLDTSISVNGWAQGRKGDTSITSTRSKIESRLSRSPFPQRTYSIPWQHLSLAQRRYLAKFSDGRNTNVYSFLIWDRDDFYVENQQIGVGNGSNHVFQLVYPGGDTARSFLRKANKPIPTGTTVPAELRGVVSGHPSTTTNRIYVNGTPLTEGSGFTIDPLTGLATLTTAPSNGAIVTATFWYYVNVRFETDNFKIEMDGILGRVSTDMIEVFNE